MLQIGAGGGGPDDFSAGILATGSASVQVADSTMTKKCGGV